MLPLSYFSDRRFSVGSGIDHGVVLRDVRLLLPVLAVPPVRPRLLAARGRAGHAAVRRGVRDRVAAQRDDWPSASAAGGRSPTASLIVGVGMVLMGLIGVDTPYLVLVVAMVLLSSGMAIVAAPATSGIMNAVPMAKAGVGSAVNDTTRELGGALGIAVFGSIVNSAYRANIDLGGLGLSPAEVAEAEESIGGAAATAGAVRWRRLPRDRRAGGDGVHRRRSTSPSCISVRDRRRRCGDRRPHVHPRQGERRRAGDGDAAAGPASRRRASRRRSRARLMTWN